MGTGSVLRMGALLAALSLVAVACAQKTKPQASSPSPAASSQGSAMMAMQPGAENMKALITSPAEGTKVTDNVVTLAVATSGYNDTCDTAGRPPVQGQGHIHIAIDKPSNLVDMFCASPIKVSTQNLKPGMHKLIALPAQNDHVEVEDNASSVTIDYEPTKALPEITDASFPGPPSIKITNLKAGQSLSGAFDVAVQISNFNVNCDLEAKPDVEGYGHWHLNLDTAEGPMMGMGTLLRMGCINGVATNVIHTTTDGLKSGETHTIIALLVDNNHAPLHPLVADKVDVKIG